MKILARKWDEQKTRNSYKKVAWMYDHWSKLTESKAAKKVLELADIQNKQRILEVACGTGVLFEQIVAKNTDGFNFGIDLSPDMLKKAKRRMLDLGVQNYELKEGNALALEIKDASIDILVNNFMIDLMPEEMFDKIASEFHRVLKINGIVVISNFSFGESSLHNIWYWVAKYMPDLLTGCRPVSFIKQLINAGFIIEKDIRMSQNTFPSKVIKARKGTP